MAGENKFQTWISVHWYTNHRNKQVQFQHSITILFLVDLGLLILELQRLSVIAVLKELWLVKYIFFYYIISCINDFIFNMCSVLFIIYRNSAIEYKHISRKWEKSVSKTRRATKIDKLSQRIRHMIDSKIEKYLTFEICASTQIFVLKIMNEIVYIYIYIF